MLKKPMRVLQILPALNFCGGIENYVMNYYRHIDREKIQFDFITHTNLECSFKEEIISMGGRIYELPVFTLRSLPNILSIIDDFFLKHKDEYKIIHCHMANAACFYFWKAKKYGIENCILHSHQSSAADKFIHRLRNYPLLCIGVYLSTCKVACSNLAGKFLFKGSEFKVIKNAIEYDRFSFDLEIRKKIREKYNIDEKLVVGHIGRFCAQKNQEFLVNVFADLCKKNKNSVLIMVGNGENREYIKHLVSITNISDKVIFVDTCNNVNEFYQAFDVFVLPSLYEGLPVVGVEAQASGLPCLFSDRISDEVLISRNSKMLSLNIGYQEWSKNILLLDLVRQDNNSLIKSSGYNIYDELNVLESLYLQRGF